MQQCGKLELVFARRDGQTYLKHAFHRTPLQIVRPFALATGGVSVTIINPTAGIMGGDEFEIDVVLESHTHVELTTQSASKIHKMHPDQHAVQHVRFEVADFASLGYYPQTIIPFAESDYQQSLKVRLSTQAQFAMLETWASGRIARGERLAFRRYANSSSIWLGQDLEYLERFCLQPQATNLSAFGLLEQQTHTLSGFFTGQFNPDTPLPDFIQHGQTQQQHTWLRGISQSSLLLDQAAATVRVAMRQHMATKTSID